MKTYTLMYILADDETQTEHVFSIKAESIDYAVEMLVKSLEKNYNPANIDFTIVIENGQALGEDGIYAAEVALANQ